MKDLFLILRCNLQEDAPEGPGWYFYVHGDGTIIPPVRVAPQGAQIIGEAFDRVLNLAGVSGGPFPTQVVGSGNNLVRNALRQQLEFAEQQAQRIKALRLSLAALEEAPDTVEVPTETGDK